jgi:hypothetical protein
LTLDFLMNFGLVVIMLFLNLGCSVFGKNEVEELKYDLILKEGDKEIRHYRSYIVAQVTVDDKNNPQNKAFKILAGYIFGDNKSKSKMPMKTPVMTSEGKGSEKISMTAPVLMESEEQNKMTMSFSMPSKYTLQELPEPNDKRIKLVSIREHYAAALVFSGFWSKEKNAMLGEELMRWLLKHQEYRQISRPIFAGHNPPWTIPFLRRNEILIKLDF